MFRNNQHEVCPTHADSHVLHGFPVKFPHFKFGQGDFSILPKSSAISSIYYILLVHSNDGSVELAVYRVYNAVRFTKSEYIHWNVVFHAHYGCCQINDRKFFINDFLNGNLIIFLSGWIYFRTKAKQTTGNYGQTIGQPELSEKAAKYYEQLKKKYGNYDFILVSRDQKENAKANAAKYANGYKTVVLIDEDKIEQMATDEKFRKQYEGILSGAAAQIQQLKTSLQSSGANVKGFGMQVNDGGTLSFFAVLKKSSSNT